MELYQLCSILEKLSKVDDVRNYLKQFISNNKVNFAKAAQILNGGKLTERSQSEQPHQSRNDSDNDKSSPIPRNATNSRAQKRYTKDERKTHTKIAKNEESYTTDDRNKFTPNIMMNTWTPSNQNIENHFKKFTMMNQYKAMGLNNMPPDMHKLLSNTLNSYNNPGGRNQDQKEAKRSSKKHSRTRQHSANPKMHHSRRKKSPTRGRNDYSFGFKTNKYDDNNTMFLNLMKHSLKGTKKHKKKKSSINPPNGRDSAMIHSIMPQTMTHIGRSSIKKSNGK